MGVKLGGKLGGRWGKVRLRKIPKTRFQPNLYGKLAYTTSQLDRQNIMACSITSQVPPRGRNHCLIMKKLEIWLHFRFKIGQKWVKNHVMFM